MDEFQGILDGSLPRECGVGDVFRLRVIDVGKEACRRVPAYLLQRGYSACFLVADTRTWAAAGEALAVALEGSGVQCTHFLLADGEGGHDPCANDATVDAAREAAGTSGAGFLVSVGSGTVNDVVKMVATQLDLPFVTVPTAASMNGYTSAIAAILSKGVKRTIPTHQAEAVFADVDVVAHAPQRLNLAGFGDLASKPYSNACWYLAHHMTGSARSDAPSRLLDGPFRQLLSASAGLRTAEPDAVKVLLDTLLLSGCSMALAGSSSPASGGEHLISHYWDMVEHAANRPVRALHGTQVGVATCLSARLYETVVSRDQAAIDVETLMASYPTSPEIREAEIRGRHPNLPSEIVNEMSREAMKKALSPEEQRARLSFIRDRWDVFRAELGELLLPADAIRSALLAAGAPTRAAELGVDAETLAHTVRVCRDMRSRYTVLDFAEDLGVLETFSATCA